MNPASTRPLLSSRKDKDAADVPVSGDDNNFLIDRNEVRGMHVNVQHMIESVLQLFEQIDLERRVEDIVENKVVILSVTTNQQVAKGERTPFY